VGAGGVGGNFVAVDIGACFSGLRRIDVMAPTAAVNAALRGRGATASCALLVFGATASCRALVVLVVLVGPTTPTGAALAAWAWGAVSLPPSFFVVDKVGKAVDCFSGFLVVVFA